MDVLIGGGILATATGLAFIAYERPAAFAKMFWVLLAIGNGAMVLVMAWYVGSSQMYVAVLKFFAPEKMDVADSAFSGATNILWTSLGAYFALMVLLCVLRTLPLLGAVANRNDTDTDQSGNQPSA